MALRRIPRMLPLAVAAVSVTTLASAVPAEAKLRFSPGAPGVGDSYFPLEGNGGYDAKHYRLDLKYDPDYDQLDGVVTMTARATQNLSSFNLDLSGMDVSRVKVDGRSAAHKRRGQELTITPRKGLRKGKPFKVSITYGGSPRAIVSSPILRGSPYGFLHPPTARLSAVSLTAPRPGSRSTTTRRTRPPTTTRSRCRGASARSPTASWPASRS